MVFTALDAIPWDTFDPTAMYLLPLFLASELYQRLWDEEAPALS